MLNLLLSGMRPIIAAAKLLLFCHLGKFFALFFHKTAEIVAFTPFSATISSPFQPIDTPSAAPVFGAEIMDRSRGRTDAERGIYIHISTTFIVGDECSLLSHTQLFRLFNLTKYQLEGNTYLYLLLSAKTFFEHIKIRAGFLAWNSALLVTFVSCCKFQFK